MCSSRPGRPTERRQMVLEQEATGRLGELRVREDLFIDGEWVPGSGGDRIAVIDPATGAQIASVASADRADVRRAIAAAKRAFPLWSALLAGERASVLKRWHE